MNSNGRLIRFTELEPGSLCIYERKDGKSIIGIAAIDWEGDKVVFDIVGGVATQYDYLNDSEYVFYPENGTFEFEIQTNNFSSVERPQPSQIYLCDFGYVFALKGRYDDKINMIDLKTGKQPTHRPKKLYPVGNWKIVQNLTYKIEPLVLYDHSGSGLENRRA